MFKRILIANRGEIAVRVARTCRELGVQVVAVYSTEDQGSAVVRMADEAVHIGPAPARRSYLNVAAVVEAARRTGAEAIHPGYGFLAENPDFAEVCQANDIVYIGPPADVIGRFGDKVAARAFMADAGLPTLPGSRHALPTAEQARQTVAQIGYPVIIKAAAGGGGLGMHTVTSPAQLGRALADARATAQSQFGDDRVYVERLLCPARHVEIQILADQYGNAVHLGERDCSTQRRYQKLIEETPAPNLSREPVRRAAEAAVRGALAAGYVGAGTFEFLVDQAGGFHLLEVNCRIQVEHPVTELVTGIDLVREQLRIAAGEPLGLRQEDIVARGAAIECRINAEDPDRGFVPTPGRLTEFTPAGGPFVRVDTHAFDGYRMPASYDSLLAKLLVWAPSRAEAVNRMGRALGEFRVAGSGVRTTIPFLREVLDHPSFRTGHHTTALVDEMRAERDSRALATGPLTTSH